MQTKGQDYSTNTSVTVKPAHTGTYTVRVKAKDGAGTVKNKDFTVKVAAALTNTSKISATSIALGSSVKVTCSATGGTGTKKYAVWYKRSTVSDWTKGQRVRITQQTQALQLSPLTQVHILFV